MRKYFDKKLIKSGDVYELYEYETPILVDHKSSNGGRHNKCQDDEEKERHKETAINRTKKSIRRLVNANIEQYSKFLTLTFAEDVRELEKANYEFKKFKQRLEYKIGFRLKYLCVPEFTKKGRVHFHLIMFNLPYMKNKELSEVWKNGFIKINKIENCDNVGAYVSKYLSKDEGMEGKKRYFSSRSLNKPVEITSEKKIAQEVAAILDYETYSSCFENKYIGQINYTQFNLRSQRKQSEGDK